jgi:PAS domain S-box-containing protein
MRLRKSGIGILGEVPWGTHLCQFYKTGQDMLDILVPYFQAGLEDNEFCMWVTSDPLSVDDARQAMHEAMPGFDEAVADGRMEILPYTDWYMLDGYFDLNRVFNGWIAKLEDAQMRGLDGLRTTGNTAWLEDTDWASFTECEEALDDAIGDYPLMAVCTYSLDKCGASEVIDVVKNHRYALIKREGAWDIIESAERRKSEAEYQAIVETAMDGFWITNMDGRFLDVNDAYCRLVGYTRDELLGMSISDVETLETPGDVAAHIERLRERGHDVFETRHRGSDGRCVDVEVSVNHLDAGGGRLFVFVRDITERKKSEMQLLKVNAELDAYAHTVSHDLRSPLAAMALARSLMCDAVDSGLESEIVEESSLFADTVGRNLKSCQSLIDDLLMLAEAGQRPAATEEVDLRAVVARVSEERASDITARGVELRVDDDLGTVEASPTHMYQLFSNLINNAIRHNDAAMPVVEVSFLGTDSLGGCRYLVRDNGSGIPEEDIERVFVPFFKQGKHSDTGLGLATVEKIVNVYAGEIRAFNEGGACFEFVLRSL